MTRIHPRVLVSTLALALLLAIGGCDKPKKEWSGIGKWIINKTTLEDWGYMNMCSPSGELMWCQNSPLEKTHTVKMGGQDAVVGTYYKGTKEDAPLVEIVLTVDSCQPEPLQSWMRETFGKPTADKGKVVHWAGKLVFISAKLGSSCQVVFVAADDKKRIGELQAATE